MNDLLDEQPERDEEDIQAGGSRVPFRFRAAMDAANGTSRPAGEDVGFQPRPAEGTLPVTPSTGGGIGSRIAAGAPTGAPALASVAPSPAAPPANLVRKETPTSIPQPPVGANNQRRMDLLRQMGVLSKPTDPNAIDASGKRMYRMGLGSRIAAALADFGMGFGGRGGQPIYFGPGATNARYDRTEALREKQLGGVKEELGEQEKLDTSEQKVYEDAIKQAYEGQLGEYRTKLGEAAESRAATAGELADTKAQLSKTQGDLNEARAGKLQDPIGQRIKEADRMNLKGDDRKYYLANGKLKEGSDRAPTDLEEWTAAFRRDNGREPTADEIANRKSRTQSKADSIEKDKETELQKAEDKAAKRLDEAQKLYKFQPQKFEEQKKQIYADLENDKARVQKSYEDRARENAAQGGRRPAAAPAKPAGTPKKLDKSQFPAGSTVMVDGKSRRVVGWNDQTNKPIVAPLGQ